MIRTFIEGYGSPIILLHGGPGMGCESIAPISSLLCDRFLLVRYNQGGELPGPTCIEELVNEVAGVRQQVASSPVVLIGHSWGATLAALYAFKHPEQVAALVLVHPMEISSEHVLTSALEVERRRSSEDWKRFWANRRELARLRQHSAQRKLLEQEQLRLDFRPTCADAPHGQVLESFYFGSYDGRKASAVWQDLEKRWPGQNSEGYDLSKVYSSLRMSVLVIAGKRDVIQPESTLTIAKIANAKLIYLNNSGHWSFSKSLRPSMMPSSTFWIIRTRQPYSIGGPQKRFQHDGLLRLAADPERERLPKACIWRKAGFFPSELR